MLVSFFASPKIGAGNAAPAHPRGGTKPSRASILRFALFVGRPLEGSRTWAKSATSVAATKVYATESGKPERPRSADLTYAASAYELTTCQGLGSKEGIA